MLKIAGDVMVHPLPPDSKPGFETRLAPPAVPRKTSSRYIVPPAELKASSKLNQMRWRLPVLKTGVVNFVQVEVALTRMLDSFTVHAEFPHTWSSTEPEPFTQTLAVTFVRAVTETRW